MTTDSLPKTYDFKTTEQRLYKWWETSGFFKPEIDPARKPFIISMPPPNVTGELHTGHAMFVALEDLMIRYHRMRGEPTLWVPGSDHAGIATQLQVEKMLHDQGNSREAVGRERFVELTWDWKHKYGGIIYNQLRRLGASCDWTRERFTLDDGLSRAVREAFVRLYEKGLIYRGTYLTNWSPGLRTAVSDLEVEYTEEEVTLYYFKYLLAGRHGEYIPVATARPETILADTAVAVHPDDDRYRHLIGETCLVPILNRPIPVIHDTYVDRDFGTGALKITPGHDPNDYEIGQRHGLPIINVLNKDASMSAEAGPYAGLDRFECRQRMWADMEAAGLTLKTERYTTTVPRSQRGGEIIEPLISTQWYVKIQPLAEPALEAVRDGRIRIVPERFIKVYYNWLDASSLRDWCISRQLWWGHRIPVWHCPDGHMTTGREDPTVCGTCGSPQLEQDPDVLDTWFSSGLWPFSTLGWPDETPDLAYFYPTSVMETGYDILFFWVARMIMFGLEFTGRPPFHTVYLHGLVRDGLGRKMSKTLGNVIDPLDVMDEYGTDALRFTLLTGSTPGNDMNLSLQRVEANRNFANKIWNAARFVIGSLANVPAREPERIEWSLADRWIHARLDQTIADCNRLFENYQFGQAGSLAYDFIWGEYCDWYLETAKLQLAAQDSARAWATARTLVHVLDQALRLLHPFVPFVTEEIWQNLKRAAQAHGTHLAPGDGWPEALMLAEWPAAQAPDREAEEALARFALVMDIVRAIRNTRAEYKVKPAQRIPATLVGGAHADLLQSQREVIAALAGLERGAFDIYASLAEKPHNAASQMVGAVECYLPLEGLVDVEAERARLGKELSALDRQIERSEGLLAGDFAARAPAAVVERERAKLAGLRQSRTKLAERLAALA